MKRKEIMKAIQELKTTNLNELYELSGVFTKADKKRIQRTVISLAEEGKVQMISDTGEIKIPPRRPPKKKKPVTPPQKEGVKREKIAYSEAVNDFTGILDKYRIKNKFPNTVLNEADAIPLTIPESEYERRMDLRDRLIVTIDGEDAKDLDDAISLEKKPAGGWVLGVHIADVSYYVPKGSKLDKEATKRANSFYFINRVVPMFPERLSNGVCSLNPHEDKLTLSIFMDLDESGSVRGQHIHETVINSKHRLVYSEVQEYFDGKRSYDNPDLHEHLNLMRELFQILLKNRMEGGSIDFDFKEQKIKLDQNDEPITVYLKDRIDSERIIEEFMLLANKSVAKYLSGKGPSIFRVHEEPSTEKIRDFARMVMRFGHKLPGIPMPDPRDLQRILREVQDKPHKELISQILLRSMQQARYHTDNIGHYGLGFEYYTHFTSPIRRFADLVIHRLVKNAVKKGKKKPAYSEEELESISQHTSVTERVAMEAERDLYKIKSIRFMNDKVGKIYDGIVTGISMFGMFVQITEFGIEGLVRYYDLGDDYYVYHEQEFMAKGKHHKTQFTIGDKMKVKVKNVNITKGFLDLLILPAERKSGEAQ